MLFKRLPAVSFTTVIFALVAWFTLVLNLPILLHFWRILHQTGEYKIGFAFSITPLLFAALSVVFIPFTFRPLLKPIFCTLLIVTALASYAQYQYQVIFDRSMIENIFETNGTEARSYLSLPMVTWLIVGGVLPATLLALTPVRYSGSLLRRLVVRLTMITGALAYIALVAAVYYQDYASVGRNNRMLNQEIQPVSYLYNTVKYVSRRYFSRPVPYRIVGADAHLASTKADAKPELLFILVGETARAKNQAWQGYDRPTNPFTQRESAAFYFKNVSSCGTATAVSVPCMFSNLTRKRFDSNIARNSNSLIDVVHRAGVTTWWSDNDEGCKGVCDRTPNQIISAAATNPQCNGTTCYDSALLEGIDAKIPSDGKSKLLVFHLIGSHGPTYYRRYPPEFRYFMPDCERSDIENCSHQQLINTYDNTLRYTDYVIEQFINKLKSYQKGYNVALYYVSDHGESLGEKGLYLHGTPYAFAPTEQTHVPMLLWLPEGWRSANGVDARCLRESAGNSYSHDNLFHTVLGMLHVATQDYNPQLDMLANCRRG